MTEVKMDTVTLAEHENLERCAKEWPDPIGAKNWSNVSEELIEQIKHLSRSERITKLRNRLLDSRQQLYIRERGKLVTESYRETEGEDANIRQAKSLAHVLEKYPIYLRDDELIVGSVAPTPRGCLWFPEITDWLINEIDTISTREYNPTVVSDEDRAFYLDELHPYWKDRCSFARIQKQLPDEVREKQKYGLWTCGISMEQPIGHILALDKHRLKHGIRWYKEQALAHMESADHTDPRYVDKLQFWKAIVIICDAIHHFALRYADEAERQASCAAEPRKTELLRIASTMKKVPWEAADNFYEAVQSAWFMQLIYYYETNAVAESPGRIDQKLYEYFKKDLDRGALTLEEGCEILSCYWLKLAETNKVYESLPSGIQDALKQAGQEAQDYVNSIIQNGYADDVLQKMRDAGVNVITKADIDPADYERFRKIGMAVWADFEDEIGSDVLQKMYEFKETGEAGGDISA